MKLCVALDLPTWEQNLALVKSLKEYDIWLKVGLCSYLRDGARFLDEIKQINSEFKIFLDLKLYDIPNTMGDSAEVLANLPINMFNVHASAGKEAMSEVIKRLSRFKNRPLVLGVSVLTSFDESAFFHIYNNKIEQKAKDFAKDSYESGLDGMVCSVFESMSIKSVTCKDFITLTPGIRASLDELGDQKRVANVLTAKQNLSDFIVVGRPIYQAKEPKKVVEQILKQIFE